MKIITNIGLKSWLKIDYPQVWVAAVCVHFTKNRTPMRELHSHSAEISYTTYNITMSTLLDELKTLTTICFVYLHVLLFSQQSLYNKIS